MKWLKRIKSLSKIFCFSLLLMGCATTGQDYAVKDPIFRNADNQSEENVIIYRADGCRDYLMRDPIFRNSGKDSEENWILFRDPDCK